MKIKKNWGFLAFCLLSLIALFRTCWNLEGEVTHYRIFTAAAQDLWVGINPYGKNHGMSVGNWFYSPSCGLFFFRFFSLFPLRFGVTLYTLLSLGIFITGSLLFIKSYFGLKKITLTPSPIFHLYWVILAPQVMIGLIANKPEIIMTGILLFSANLLLVDPKSWLAPFLLAFILNWKFQPLPTLLLLSATLILSRKGGSFLFKIFGFSLFWFLLPLLIIPYAEFISLHEKWASTLDLFIRETFRAFDNIFAFLENSFHILLSYHASQFVSLFAAVFLLAVLIKRKLFSPSHFYNSGILFSLAMGSLYSLLFSPLNQVNAYVLMAPLVLVLCIFAQNEPHSLKWKALLLFLGLGITFSYSELTPESIRVFCRSHALRPLILFLVGIPIL